MSCLLFNEIIWFTGWFSWLSLENFFKFIQISILPLLLYLQDPNRKGFKVLYFLTGDLFFLSFVLLCFVLFSLFFPLDISIWKAFITLFSIQIYIFFICVIQFGVKPVQDSFLVSVLAIGFRDLEILFLLLISSNYVLIMFMFSFKFLNTFIIHVKYLTYNSTILFLVLFLVVGFSHS